MASDWRFSDDTRGASTISESEPRLEAVIAPDEVTIAAAVEIFFGDLRLAPRSRTTYRQGLRKFLEHLERHRRRGGILLLRDGGAAQEEEHDDGVENRFHRR